jgi:O-antigen ligase
VTITQSVESVEGGSPLDRLVLSILIILALLILFRRKIEWSRILKDNFWLILLFLYMGLSILWSDFPFVSFKRWIRSSAVILMALVVLSERKPFQALESIFRRSAYVLIPFSLVLVKYFPIYGRQYGIWEGKEMWTGVATQKNGLGQICALFAIVLIWAALKDWRSGDFLKIKSQAFADALVLAIAFFLLRGPGISYSATSIGILSIGIATLLLLYWSENLARWLTTHLKAIIVALALILLLIGDSLVKIVASTFGRDETLTGRTEIWNTLLDFASRNPLFGVGYGGFWGLETEITSKLGVGQSHNGYIEVYLELGIVGIVLLSAFLLAFCGRIRRELYHLFDWGVFGICFLLIALLYNITESAFLSTGVFSVPCLRTNRD